MIFLSGGLVHFSSQLQRITAQSTSEAELIAMNTCAKHGIYLSGILCELGWPALRNFILHSDNRGSLILAATSNFSSRSKHIYIRFAALKDWITEGTIKAKHVSSADQLADICTKFCARPIFDMLMSKETAFN